MVNEPDRICPWQQAWFLDNWVRRAIHNPDRIIGKYIEKGQTFLDLGYGQAFSPWPWQEWWGKMER